MNAVFPGTGCGFFFLKVSTEGVAGSPVHGTPCLQREWDRILREPAQFLSWSLAALVVSEANLWRLSSQAWGFTATVRSGNSYAPARRSEWLSSRGFTICPFLREFSENAFCISAAPLFLPEGLKILSGCAIGLPRGLAS